MSSLSSHRFLTMSSMPLLCRKNGKHNEQSTTFILGKTMDENNGNGKTEFQFESEEHCFNTCNITQPEWCRNIEVGLS